MTSFETLDLTSLSTVTGGQARTAPRPVRRSQPKPIRRITDFDGLRPRWPGVGSGVPVGFHDPD